MYKCIWGPVGVRHPWLCDLDVLDRGAGCDEVLHLTWGATHTIMLCIGGGVQLGVSMETADSRFTGSLGGWKCTDTYFGFFSKQTPRATTAGSLS